MATAKNKRFSADFETTTSADDCRVWAWGMYEIESDTFTHGQDLNEFLNYIFTIKGNSKIYFHNLKFDGEFIMYGLFRNNYVFVNSLPKYDKEFTTLITDMGVFYSITIVNNGHTITLLDSVKIIPLPIRKISKAFGISQLKGDIDYHLNRPVGYVPDDNEISYLQNDCEIAGKALNYFFKQNLKKITQASNAFYDFKHTLEERMFEAYFPSIEEIDSEIRQAYKGGYSYVNPKFQGKDIPSGIVLDVNSLYPSVMYDDLLPFGEPVYYEGKYQKDKFYPLYIQLFRCQFKLKKGHLPTIQLKSNYRFNPTEYCTNSDNEDVTLYLTSVDLKLFLKHYNVYDLEYICGWKFKASNKIFKPYIDKWMSIKEQASIDKNEGLRTIAKLMLNSLYGKFGLNPNARKKIPMFDGEYVHYVNGENETRPTIYVALASFVTAYARRKTITSAQQNYKTFVYADTDSLHLLQDTPPDNLDIDSVKLGYWKYELKFKRARFLRSKSYVEEYYESEQPDYKGDPIPDEKPLLKIAVAGLPKECHKKITFDNFKNGLVVKGKLAHKRVKGGVILQETDFEIKL